MQEQNWLTPLAHLNRICWQFIDFGGTRSSYKSLRLSLTSTMNKLHYKEESPDKFSLDNGMNTWKYHVGWMLRKHWHLSERWYGKCCTNANWSMWKTIHEAYQPQVPLYLLSVRDDLLKNTSQIHYIHTTSMKDV
jgi:hypothetical protein